MTQISSLPPSFIPTTADLRLLLRPKRISNVCVDQPWTLHCPPFTFLNLDQQIYLIKTQIVANLTEWDLFFCLKLELKHSEFLLLNKRRIKILPASRRWRFYQGNCYFMQNKRNVSLDGCSSSFCNLDENFADDLMTQTKTEQLKLRSGLVLVPLFKPQIRSDQIRLSVTV